MQPWAKNLLHKKLNLEKFQNPNVNLGIAIEALEYKQRTGEIIIVGSSKHNILHILNPKTMWIAEYDIVADTKNGSTLFKECKKAQDWFWENYNYHKLEMTTIDRKVARLAKKLGWEQEGMRKESYLDYTTGQWKDEFLFGLIRPQES